MSSSNSNTSTSSGDPMTMSNSAAIRLNNEAVLALKAGSAVRAFEMLSKSSKVISSAGANHVHVDTSNATYRFHWEDCKLAAATDLVSKEDKSSGRLRTASDGSSAFLFLRGLRVTTPVCSDEEIDGLCPCGYAWVVWYNLALCCSLLGTRLGERGQMLLKTAFDLYDRVQRRIDNEPPSKQWNILQMAVLNNQACIYQDFAMSDAIYTCLERLAQTMSRSPSVQGTERETFLLNLQILGSHSVAAAA